MKKSRILLIVSIILGITSPSLLAIEIINNTLPESSIMFPIISFIAMIVSVHLMKLQINREIQNDIKNIECEFVNVVKETNIYRNSLLSLLFLFSLSSCTENDTVKNWGGTGTIKLSPGRKLVNITWKETEVWYLTRPMTTADTATTYEFHEKSSFGVNEGTYIVVESK